MRNLLCFNTYTSNCSTIGNMGWTDISVTIKMNMLRTWNRSFQLSNIRLVKTIFNVDFMECRKKWTFEVKQLAAEIDQFSSVETI